MRLTELGPRFVRYDTRLEVRTFCVGDPLAWKAGDPTEERETDVEYLVFVDELAAAQGVMFKCPLCYPKAGGPKGVHLVEVTFAGRGVRDDEGCHNRDGQPTRWTVLGTGVADLTIAPSIELQGGCGWHGYVTNGVAK